MRTDPSEKTIKLTLTHTVTIDPQLWRREYSLPLGSSVSEVSTDVRQYFELTRSTPTVAVFDDRNEDCFPFLPRMRDTVPGGTGECTGHVETNP